MVATVLVRIRQGIQATTRICFGPQRCNSSLDSIFVLASICLPTLERRFTGHSVSGNVVDVGLASRHA